MSHGLPYEWHPLGAISWFMSHRHDGNSGPFEAGTLIPWAHRVYVLAEVRPIPEDQWTDDERAVVFRARLELEDYKGREDKLSRWWQEYLNHGQGPRFYTFAPYPQPLDPVAASEALERDGLETRGWMVKGRQGSPDYYPDEHYPVCAKCGEPTPCRDQMAMTEAARSIRLMDDYTDPAKCPACKEPVTARQGRETFEWNLHVPAGPPVSFHTRQKCLGGLVRYRDDLKAAGYFSLKALDPDRED